MRRIAVPTILACLFLAGSGFAASSPEPRIVDIHGHVKDREAVVHFTLLNAFTPEMVEALKSGIEISFKTVVRVERVHHGWFNTYMGELTFSRSVRYDALARVFRLHRGRGEEIVPDILTALEGMTQYDVAIPVSGSVERGKPYRAHVRTRLDKVGLSEPLKSIFFFSSLWDLETEWARGALLAP